jgi:hypothetical protein
MGRIFTKARHAAVWCLLALAAGGCAWLDRKQGELIFNPVQGQWRGFAGLPEGMREEWIPVGTNGELLHAWWMPAANADAPALLYLHGARWNLTGSVTRIPRWQRMGFSVLAIDYRGFGRSAGSGNVPSEASAVEDAVAAWAHLAQLAPGARRFIFGHSLGASIATALALQRPDAEGLILEGAFTSVADMIRETRWGFLPVSFLITQRFDTLGMIVRVTQPLLVVHGSADTTVPVAMGERLYAAARSPKRFLRLEGGSHHNLTAAYFDEYRRAVAEHFRLAAGGARAAAPAAAMLGGARSEAAK